MSTSRTPNARRRLLQQQQIQQLQRQGGQRQGVQPPSGGESLASESGRMVRDASRAMPLTAKLRLIALVALTVFMIAAIAAVGVETRKRYDTFSKAHKHIKQTDTILTQTDALIQENLYATIPTCVAFGQEDLDIGSTFPDDLFGVHTPGDPDAIIRFDLGDLLPSQTVTLTIQDASGIVAFLTDIQPITTEFADDEFRMHNQADETKEIQFDLSNLLSATMVSLAVQNVSGTVAYLSDVLAAGAVFLDSEFTIFNAIDPTKKFMFDAGLISPSTSRTLETQLTNGTIAYIADVNVGGFPLSDADFLLANAADNTKRMQFDVGAVPASSEIDVRIQDHSGTIAYVGDLHALPFKEVLVTSPRQFPAIGIEGVATIAELGDVYLIELSLCGGGGGGGDVANNGSAGGGGGGGSGHRDFPISNPGDRFNYLDITVGSAGSTSAGAAGGWGGMTIVLGVSTNDVWHLDVRGFGGQGGQEGQSISPGAYGGGGGGSAGVAVGTTPGPAGLLGGFEGGLGGNWPGNPESPNGVSGDLTSSWRAGGGGGGENGQGGAFFGTSYSVVCPNGSGGAGCGANSMFGRGGTEASPYGDLCAGGSGGSTVNSPGLGGAGAVLIRYYLRSE